jgi:hypothetical protein
MPLKNLQKEAGKMLSSRSSSHQYIVGQALKLISSNSPDTELATYGSHIMAGALHEDYFFFPGDSLKTLILDKEKLSRPLPATKEELGLVASGMSIESIIMERNKENERPTGFLLWIVKRGSELLRKLGVSQIDDPLNKPYMAHFYNPRKFDEIDQGLDLRGGLKFVSSKKMAMKYWNAALDSYVAGDRSKAYLCIGHMSHLIQDMCVPAHVHNDPHGPTLILGKLDSFETYMAKPKFFSPPNIRKWKAGNVPQPELTPGWQAESFMDRIAFETYMFRSVDGKGMQLEQETIKYQFKRFNQVYDDEKFNKYLDQQKTGKLSDDECRFQGSVLIPKAIFHTAELLMQFRKFPKIDPAKINPGPVNV